MSIMQKLRIWGLKGAVDYIVARISAHRKAQIFKKNAHKYPFANPQMGITVVGALSDQGSLNKTLRDFCFSLKDAGIPFQTYDLGSNQIPTEDISPILTRREDFRVARYTNLVEMISSPVPDGIVKKRSRIVFWEFESGLLEGYPVLMERQGDVVGMSDFNFNYYKDVFRGKRNIYKILYPLRVSTKGVLSIENARLRFNIPLNAFVVFYNFSYKSGLDRKNPEGAIKAFAKALSKKQNAMLVLKTAAASEYPNRVASLHTLVRELNISDKVHFVDEYMSQQDVFNLTNACDVYLSLHRAEGFGLGIAEAMSLGKPVVVTNYSSPTEFCNDSNSILVGYDLAPVRTENKLYNSVEQWAEPSVDKAADALLRLYADSDLSERLGGAARESILRQYSIDNFKKSIVEYLSLDGAIPT